jgi:hypothetical protein
MFLALTLTMLMEWSSLVKDGAGSRDEHRSGRCRDVTVLLRRAMQPRQVRGRWRSSGVDELRVRPSHCSQLRRVGVVAEVFRRRQLRYVMAMEKCMIDRRASHSSVRH